MFENKKFLDFNYLKFLLSKIIIDYNKILRFFTYYYYYSKHNLPEISGVILLEVYVEIFRGELKKKNLFYKINE